MPRKALAVDQKYAVLIGSSSITRTPSVVNIYIDIYILDCSNNNLTFLKANMINSGDAARAGREGTKMCAYFWATRYKDNIPCCKYFDNLTFQRQT